MNESEQFKPEATAPRIEAEADQQRAFQWPAEQSTETGVIRTDSAQELDIPLPEPQNEIERRHQVDLEVRGNYQEAHLDNEQIVEITAQIRSDVLGSAARIYEKAEFTYEQRVEAANSLAEELIGAIVRQRDRFINQQLELRQSREQKADRMTLAVNTLQREVAAVTTDFMNKIATGEEVQSTYEKYREQLAARLNAQVEEYSGLNEKLSAAKGRVTKYTDRLRIDEAEKDTLASAHGSLTIQEEAAREIEAQKYYPGINKTSNNDEELRAKAYQITRKKVSNAQIIKLQSLIQLTQEDRVTNLERIKADVAAKDAAEITVSQIEDEQVGLRQEILTTGEALVALVAHHEGQLNQHSMRMLDITKELREKITAGINPLQQEEVHSSLVGVKTAIVELKRAITLGAHAENDGEWTLEIAAPADMALPSQISGQEISLLEESQQEKTEKQALVTSIEAVNEVFNLRAIWSEVAAKGILRARTAKTWLSTKAESKPSED